MASIVLIGMGCTRLMRTWPQRLRAGLLLCALFASGCAPASDARDVTESFYDAYGRNQMERVWSLYAPEFFEEHPKHAWARQLQKLRETVGSYRSHRLVSQRKGTTEAKGAAFTVLTYEVQYSKQQTTETFTLRGAGSTGRPRIIRHDVRYVPRLSRR